MSESSCLEATYRFCRALIAVFGEEFLCQPTVEDTIPSVINQPFQRFPGMLGRSYKGHSEGCTMILETVASHDTWTVPDVDFEINGHHYNKGYYLVDGIYPPWATLLKTIHRPNSEQEASFCQRAGGKLLPKSKR
ncbi:uncharacterized protein [Lolium perenne]|uniref:uncharacterized protein n=1 Tax=Lolium perenne TaxID=4522 RepID=UPI003A996BAD